MQAYLLKARLGSLCWGRSFRDVKRSETVGLVSRVDLLGLAGPVVHVCDILDVERGSAC
jgi:hypothetical protein